MARWIFTLITASIVCSLSVLALTAHADVQQGWLQRYGGSGDDEALAIAKDPEGNVYVTGYTWNGSNYGKDFITIKYNLMGEMLWCDVIPNPGDDIARAIVVYGDGVYVTGEFTVGSHLEYCTVKYDKDAVIGDTLWVRTYSGTGYDFMAYGIGANNEGIYVTGEGWTGEGLLDEADIYTVRYSHSGNMIRSMRWDRDSILPNDDFASAIAVDSSGVYVAGGTSHNIYIWDYVVIGYDPDLDERWDYIYDGPGLVTSFDFAWDIAKSGNYVYVTGECNGNLTGQDYATIKLSAFSGTALDTARYIGSGDDVASAIAVYHGDVYVTGKSENGGNFDYATVKYNGNLVEQWSKIYGTGNGYDAAKDIAVNSTGVYVTGESYSSGDGQDYATVAYAHNGGDLWVMKYDGPASNTDKANALVVHCYNMYVTGGSKGTPTSNGLDIATIRYNYGPWIELTLTGTGTIPDSGGTLDYSLAAGNYNDQEAVTVDVSVNLTLPDGSPFGPVAEVLNQVLQPNSSHNRDMELLVPERAPAGTYSLNAWIGEMLVTPGGDLPNYDEDYVLFFKEGTNSGAGSVQPWFGDGGEYPENAMNISTLPEACELSQNYPNPFNPETTIRFALPEASRVELSVFDVRGRTVVTLVNGWRNPGVHEVVFNGADLVSGLYFYRIKAGEFTAGGKMILMK